MIQVEAQRPGCLIIYPTTEASAGITDESSLCLCSGELAAVQMFMAAAPLFYVILISNYIARGPIYTHLLRRGAAG